MTIKELKNQLGDILNNGIIKLINTDDISRFKPAFPKVSDISLINDNRIVLSDDQIDDLNEGKSIKINFDLIGSYRCSTLDGNLTSENNYFNFHVSNLTLQIVDEKLKIINHSCYATKD